MHARDVMTSPVITATPQTTLPEIVTLMLEHHISALPVIDGALGLVGIVSEGDLIRRKEIGFEKTHGLSLIYASILYLPLSSLSNSILSVSCSQINCPSYFIFKSARRGSFTTSLV